MIGSRTPCLFLTLCCGALGLALPGNAQGLGDTFFTVGTTTEDIDSDGEVWNFLVWQSADFELLQGGTYAIYRKVGPADSFQPYALRGIAQLRTDPLSLGALIQQAAPLGENRSELETHIDGLFEDLMPIAGLTLEEKLGAVLEGAQFESAIFQKMVFLARRHPAVALAMGLAFADVASAGVVYTYEVRPCPPLPADPATDCDTVIGRITLRSAEVRPLPAPGAPVEVPFVDNAGSRDPRNNLVARLRWATPAELRRHSLLQFGYNLYRMSEDDAIAAGFHLAPPDPGELRALALDSDHTTTLVNEAPILIDPLLGPAEAANIIADPDTYYIIDDNDRYAPGGEPFANGEVYYYFVTSLDLLLRDGEVSPGTPVLMCDTLPPPPPTNLTVTNEYTYDEGAETNYQHFKVRWDPSDVSKRINPEAVVAYRVYRWWSIDEMHAQASQPDLDATNTRGGLIGIVGDGTTEFVDDGADAPFLRAERQADGSVDVEQSYAGLTFWYTVRAVDQSACGGNLSGNSAPDFGVLRDRRGPPKPSGQVLIDCLQLSLNLANEGEVISPWVSAPEAGSVYLEFEITRDHPRIRYGEFYFDRGTADEVSLGRFAFPPGGTSPLRARLIVPEDTYVEANLIGVRILDGGDLASPWVSFDFSDTIPETRTIRFKLAGRAEATSVESEGDCRSHPTTQPDGTINPVIVEVDLTPGTEEYKVYRRVDDGPLTLIGQGLASGAEIISVLVEDLNLPLNAARLCYFVQLFDEHGNPSPMVRLACIETDAREDLPVPMLSAPESVGSENDPDAELTWFCPPYGVERFRLWVRADDTEPLPAELGPQLRTKGTPVIFEGDAFHPYETVRISSSFGNGPEFTVLLDGIEAGREYTFFVEALGSGGSASDASNRQTYRWRLDTDDTVSGPNVPWPARPLPNINPTFADGVEAILFPDGVFDGGLVRIGRMVFPDIDLPRTYADGTSDFVFPPGSFLGPIDTVFKNADGERLTPFVLYRFQVSNPVFPDVSGDIYQVSPLIENFATLEKIWIPNGQTYWENHDAFLAAAPTDPAIHPDAQDLFAKDTSPVISGASYRYLIVRYDPVTHEIAEIIPTNSITIP